ncbi:ThiF family adenylyltransferase [Pseudomonas putida]|uniref:UBA/THIF-type NAD/FAD binding protein n=1 Tax=Pseudomonas putida (strain DOT-T1E) TaxID=1196325 RepID=I7BF79_PSEPT|nr:ThiF family adenylyltransferase [Pseudomonas putida]AFO50388.1 UBA/THIF-type NAD/FAD binding protein [Pseudomonas putida DOT-T1E]UZM95856.1 ThiF family adenylyltransferase [Pseudomonas putida DOT-T1E]
MGSQNEAVIEALETRGFRYVGRDAQRWLSFLGYLNTSEGEHDCELVVDPEFYELPRVRLLSVPDALLPIAPHIGGNGSICYLTKNTVVLDFFDPVGQTLRCVDEAQSVLGKVLRKEMVEDLTEEFFVHWYAGQCIFDVQKPILGEVPGFCLLGRTGERFPVISDDLRATSLKLDVMGFEAKRERIPAYIVKTQVEPRPSQKDWPPKTVADFLEWQRQLDGRCAKKVEQRLGEASRLTKRDALIIIKSPNMRYGIHVHFDQSVLPDEKLALARGTQRLYSYKISRLHVLRLDSEYIAQRNIPALQTLAGKSIAVVGCGTIGGYLIDALAKAGAGTGGGELTIVDNEVLGPQNLGRHRLGMGHLFLNKAFGMRLTLQFDNPSVAVRALDVDARRAHLGAVDLLIDATGDESLGHWLAARYANQVPMLSIWIEGPGVAVRGLMKQPGPSGCYRCLCNHQRAGGLPTVKGLMPALRAGHGCEGLYVPFPATVSLQAAALGAEMALAWVNKRESPSLRTKITDSGYELDTPDCDVLKAERCPACCK